MSNNRFNGIDTYISKYNDKIDVLSAPTDTRNALKRNLYYDSPTYTDKFSNE